MTRRSLFRRLCSHVTGRSRSVLARLPSPRIYIGQCPEPATEPDTPLAFEQPTLTYNEEELVQLAREGKTEHAQEILRQANKTPEDLKSNPAFQNILEHANGSISSPVV